MNLDKYHKLAKQAEVFDPSAVSPFDARLNYFTTGLAGEVGEAANQVQKIMRGDVRDDPEAYAAKLALIKSELGGVYWFLDALACHLGSSMQEVVNVSAKTIAGRVERGTIRGDGNNR